MDTWPCEMNVISDKSKVIILLIRDILSCRFEYLNIVFPNACCSAGCGQLILFEVVTCIRSFVNWVNQYLQSLKCMLSL